MVTSTWNDDDTVVPIDSSVSETLRERAAEALAEYMACQEKGKNRNALEINQHVCDHHYGFDMNTNAGEYLLPSGDSRLSVTRLANSLASKIPVKSKHPSCKGDEVLHNIHKSPDHVKRSYEKPKYKWKKKPIKLLDEACKSQASLDTIDTVLNGLKPETKGNISKIPVKVKYNKCCNCKFNDIMYSLKSSMKSLQDIEDKRTSNLKYSLQDQIPTITDESACLINLDSFEKSLTQELPERSPERSPTQQLELSRGSPEKSLTQQLSTGSPERSPTHQLELSTGSPSRDHDREEDLSFTLPSLDYNREDSYILPPTTKVNRQALEYTKTEVARTVYELPRRTSSWLPGLFSQLMSNLIVALLVVLICKVFLQQFQCPSIVQSECMFSLW